jgi:TonB family protein
MLAVDAGGAALVFLSIVALASAWQASPDKPEAIAPPLIRVVPPPVAAPRLWRRAEPMRPLASYLIGDDYPAEAWYNDEEGVVAFRLLIGTNGDIRDCQVVRSSGAPSLDEATCLIMRTRPRFTAAVGLDGRPAEDSLEARIRWVLEKEEERPDADPDGDPPAASIVQRARPRAPLASLVSGDDFPAEVRDRARAPVARFRLAIAPDGAVVGCEPLRGRGTAAVDDATCALMRSRARFNPARDANGNPAADSYRGHISWADIKVEPGPPPRPGAVSDP